MIRETLQKEIEEILKDLGAHAPKVILEHPTELSHGDYATNVALSYAKQFGQNPKALAELIVEKLKAKEDTLINDISIAGPGFINITLAPTFYTESLKTILAQEKLWGANTVLAGKKVMVEYTQPNPFKPFHIGHLMSNSIGEAVSRIVEFSGAKTIRANYQGDVGLHVAKAIYSIQDKIQSDTELFSELKKLSPREAANYIGERYMEASLANDLAPELHKEKIDTINKKIYDRSDSEINAIYDWGRAITLEAFEIIYKKLGTSFSHYFFESEMAPIGTKIVRDNVPHVFEESDGAIVFHAENYDPKLHTRVFISSLGLPMYETKEIGLTMTKFEKENPDISITTTAVEQKEYMKVVTKAIEQIQPDYAARMKHVTHGMMRLASGKMSSRKGNVVTGESLIEDSCDVVREKIKDRDFSADDKEHIAEVVGIAALKYSILRSSLGSDIVYDFEKSISFEGDSGPYLQYATVRAATILSKAKGLGFTPAVHTTTTPSALERYLYRFPEIVERSLQDYEPHHVVTYLSELAGSFNHYYASEQVIDATNKVETEHRLAVVQAFYQTMRNGLHLLAIQVPEKM
jgi:arginyl-tRNA synthetase